MLKMHFCFGLLACSWQRKEFLKLLFIHLLFVSFQFCIWCLFVFVCLFSRTQLCFVILTVLWMVFFFSLFILLKIVCIFVTLFVYILCHFRLYSGFIVKRKKPHLCLLYNILTIYLIFMILNWNDSFKKVNILYILYM